MNTFSHILLLCSKLFLPSAGCLIPIVQLVYRVSQEESSIFWEIIVSVILSKNVYTNMCPIPKGFRDRAI